MQRERAGSERGLSGLPPPQPGPRLAELYCVLVSAAVRRNGRHLRPYAAEKQVPLVGLTAGSGIALQSLATPVALGSPGLLGVSYPPMT